MELGGVVTEQVMAQMPQTPFPTHSLAQEGQPTPAGGSFPPVAAPGPGALPLSPLVSAGSPLCPAGGGEGAGSQRGCTPTFCSDALAERGLHAGAGFDGLQGEPGDGSSRVSREERGDNDGWRAASVTGPRRAVKDDQMS